MLTDRVASFYRDLRWDGWAEDVAALPPDRAFHAHPPLWARADGPRSRRPVPVDELWALAAPTGRTS